MTQYGVHLQRGYEERLTLSGGKGCPVMYCQRPIKFQSLCSGHYSRLLNTGTTFHVWESGFGPKLVEKGDGYLLRRINGVHELEHRVQMELHLKRFLEPSETVHHINGDRSDNRVENLQLRTGDHGKGAKGQCQDCGSNNVIFVRLD